MRQEYNQEKRKSIRLKAPITLTYYSKSGGAVYRKGCTDISPDGVKFFDDSETPVGKKLEIKLEASDISNPVHLDGVVIWSRKISLEDGAPFTTGVKFSGIEEDNKNTFLKFLCDLLYA